MGHSTVTYLKFFKDSALFGVYSFFNFPFEETKLACLVGLFEGKFIGIKHIMYDPQ